MMGVVASCRRRSPNHCGSLQQEQQVQLGLVLRAAERGSIPVHCCAAAAAAHAVAVAGHA